MFYSSIGKRFFTTTAARCMKDTIQLTLFTKEACPLCEEAKEVLKKKIFTDKSIDLKLLNYQEVDILKPENLKWHDMYVYDIPVLHIDREAQSRPIKFMHRLDAEELIEELSQKL
ncbi:hypothetical protein PACTADRAFT_49889 [Pachysolen tannophilus NRRL Y-2460]|uniref:Glutaredoxin-like protein n=1 Tax=Pachysolen tannophilus NRRL Y-2460 TaxID=669874 RepID=A0A1E4TTR4_PACTA|nr:hypothetical protein PACTADRAFT_49889 [Pachysolen tannophilus NRRL Y-2460]